MPPNAPIAVVHLVRAANGPKPLRTFLDSYAAYDAGIEHELVLVFKGFNDPPTEEYERMLARIPHRRISVSDEGYDVNVYFRVAREQQADLYCFLNSYSEILAPNWLRKLRAAIGIPGVGLVGATGSWQSIFSNYDDATRVLPPMLPQQPRWKRFLGENLPFLRRVRFVVRRRLLKGTFEPFPNYHLRTNAFMLRRETALGIKVPPIRRKFDAYLFESGREGLTMQVLAMEQRVLVVGRDGTTYEKDEWCRSNTFWRSNQEDLLVADNQTRSYAAADMTARLTYSTYAWGSEADPGTTT